MNRWRFGSGASHLHWFSTIISVWMFLSPLFTPLPIASAAHAIDAVASADVFPGWWQAAPLGSATTDISRSVKLLPAWWPPAGPVAAPRVRPLRSGSVNSFAVTTPPTATAGVVFSTTISAKDISNDTVGVTKTISLTTTNGGTISPTTAYLISGTWTGNVSLTAAGVDRTVRAISGTITGQNTITVYAAALTTLTLTPDAAQVTVGESQTFTATGTDAYSNPVSLTLDWDSDVGVAVSDTHGLTATATFTAQTTPALGIVTATQGSVSATAAVTIVAGSLFTLTVTPNPATVTVGLTETFSAAGADQYGNNVPVSPTWAASGGDIDPGPGVTSLFTAQVTATAGAWVTATHSGVTGTALVNLAHGPVVAFVISPTGISTQTAGADFPLTVEAQDVYGNRATRYNGAPSLSDSTGTIAPTSLPFSSGLWTGTVSITQAAAGVVITVSDGLTTGNSNAFTVLPAGLHHFDMTGYPASVVAGQQFASSVVVTAFDQFDNVKTNYAGAVYFESDDGQAILTYDSSNPYPFGSSEQGVHSFPGSAFELRTTVTRHITVTDGTVSQMSAGIVVQPAGLERFGLSGYPTVVKAGTAWDAYAASVMVTAFDPYDNVKTDYVGDVYFTSDDPLAVLPYTISQRYTFTSADAGSHSFSAGGFELRTTPTRYITVTNGITAEQSTAITVNPDDLDYFLIGDIIDHVAGVSFVLWLTAYDQWDNIKTDYDARPYLSDATGTLLPVQTGVGCFSSGICMQTGVVITRVWTDDYITVTDGAVQDSQGPFDVTPAPADHIRINSAADNGGESWGYPVEVGAHTMTIYDTYTAWAAAYDQYDNYREDVSATWGGTGVLSTGAFVPNPGVSTTFTPAPILSGTGTLTAIGSGFSDATGQFHIQAPKLTITKGDNQPDDEIEAGGFLQYSLHYANVGNAAAQNVRITETYDSLVSFLGAAPGPNIPPNVWTFSTLGVGQSGDINVFVQVGSSIDPGSVLTNLVTIGGSRLAQVTTTETTVVTSTPDLILTLTGLPDPVNAGNNLVYQIHYANDGTAPVSNVYITMTYDDNLTFFSSSTPPLTGTNNVWTITQVPGGGDGDIYVTVVVDGYMLDQDTLISEAAINSDQTAEFSQPELTAVNAPVLALAKQATPSPVQANSLLTFTLAYTNTGHANAQAVYLTDTIPDHTTFVAGSCSPTCQKIDNILRWNIGTLAANGGHGAASFRVNVHDNLDDGLWLTNTAKLNAWYGYSASASLNTPVESAPALTLSLAANREPIRVTDELVYTLTYANLGNGPAYGVVLTDVIPEHVSGVSGCNPGDNCARNDRWLTWTLGTVAASAGDQFVLRMTVDAPLSDHTLLTHTAAISATARTRAAALLTSTVIAPHLALAMSDAPDPVEADAWLTFTFVYTNSGDGYAASATLTATLPEHANFDSCSPAPCDQNGSVVEWDLGQVAGQSDGTALLVMRVDNSLDNGTILSGSSRLEAAAEMVEASAGLTTMVSSRPSIWVDLDNGRASVEAGDRLTYTLQYANDGNSNAYNTTLVVDLPDPALVSYQECQPAGLCTRTGNQVTFELDTVAGGAVGAVYVIVKVVDPLPAGLHSIEAAATINTATPGDLPNDNTDQDQDAVVTRPDLQIHAGYDDHTPYPGKRLTYAVQYSNTGHIAATGVVISVTLSEHVTYESGLSSGWQALGGGHFRYTVNTLDYNQKGDLVLVVTLPEDVFTPEMENFDAVFEIYDSGGSGVDGNLTNNHELSPLGVPDVIVESVQVNWATLLSHQMGQHITVTLKNQGSGIACNPIGALPDFCGPFYVDVYFNPNPAPPAYGPPYGLAYYDKAGPIYPGQSLIVPVYPFQLPANIQSPIAIYVWVDNYELNRPYGLAPEYNEGNNVYGPVVQDYNIYLPLVLRNP